MFMDGLFYSAISHNLSMGIGSFWDLHFSKTLFKHFHEHPPLAMLIESWFFELFGDSRFVDKIHTLVMTLFNAALIVQLWKTTSQKKEISWVPVFLWMLTPIVFWSSSNNVLENTLSIFTTLSVIFIFKSHVKRHYLYILISGICIALGFLTKGFVALFPLVLFFILWLFVRSMSFSKMIYSTAMLIFWSIFPILLLVFISAEAYNSLFAYFNIQVVKSITSIATVDSRFYILKRLLSELIVPLIICLLFYFIFRKKVDVEKERNSNRSLILVFVTLGLSAVIPIMISMKQSGFYILTAYPFFAIAFTLLFENHFLTFTNKLISTDINITRFSISVVFLFTLGIVLTTFFSTKYGNDEYKVRAMRSIIQQVPKNSMLSICPSLYEDWSLHAYYKRYHLINLDSKNLGKYLLIDENNCSDFKVPKNYIEIPLKTREYQLYIKD
jgi:4-amino-4-deoxy-L-arabinose transferase-like glycosyltransferase